MWIRTSSYPNGSRLLKDPLFDECYQYRREFGVLRHLTQSECSSTPKHVAHFRRDKDNAWVENGFLCFVVKEKVSGTNASNFWKTGHGRVRTASHTGSI